MGYMSDGRLELVAAALRKHQRAEYGQHDGWWECTCMSQGFGPADEYAPTQPFTPEHQAQMVLDALSAVRAGRVRYEHRLAPDGRGQGMRVCVDCGRTEPRDDQYCGRWQYTEARAIGVSVPETVGLEQPPGASLSQRLRKAGGER